jgi:hypothetical protein
MSGITEFEQLMPLLDQTDLSEVNVHLDNKLALDISDFLFPFLLKYFHIFVSLTVFHLNVFVQCFLISGPNFLLVLLMHVELSEVNVHLDNKLALDISDFVKSKGIHHDQMCNWFCQISKTIISTKVL